MTRWREILFTQWKDIATDAAEWFELGLVMLIKRDILWKGDVEKFDGDKYITHGSQKWK